MTQPFYNSIEDLLTQKFPSALASKHVDFTIISNQYTNSAFENRIFENLRTNHMMTWGTLIDAFNKVGHVICRRKEDPVFFIPSSFFPADKPAVIPAKYTEHDEKIGMGKEGEVKQDEDGTIYVGRYGINVQFWYMLPVDVDDGLPLEEAKKRFQQWEHIGYTSFNHMKNGVEKYRILLLLDEPVSNIDFQARRGSIKNFLGDGIDTTCLSAARGFYWASCHKDRQDVADKWHNRGKALNLIKQCPEDPKVEYDITEYTRHVSIEDKDKLLNLLKNTQIPDYDHWWKMISAMIASGYSQMDLEFVSANNPLHKGNRGYKSSSDCRKYWSNVNGYNSRVGGISPGFLWNLVNDYCIETPEPKEKTMKELMQEKIESNKRKHT